MVSVVPFSLSSTPLRIAWKTRPNFIRSQFTPKQAKPIETSHSNLLSSFGHGTGANKILMPIRIAMTNKTPPHRHHFEYISIKKQRKINLNKINHLFGKIGNHLQQCQKLIGAVSLSLHPLHPLLLWLSNSRAIFCHSQEPFYV